MVAASLQQGETVIIEAEPEHQELVRELTRVSYQNGARYVKTEYIDELTDEIRAEASKKELLDYYPQWLYDYRKAYGRDKICVISLRTPRLRLDRQAGEELLRVQKTERECRAGFDDSASDGSVSIVKTVVPDEEWARIVYPELPPEEALKSLWEVYAKICRLDQPDPVMAWRKHQQMLCKRKTQLAELGIRTLYLKGPGTDLSVKLIEGGGWIGGCAENTRTGELYVPNIPTEEIFSVPDKRNINGVVSSTLPLNYKGALIEGIRLEVRDGEVVGFSAESGEDTLASIIHTDEGSRRFGEISLVPVQSPIYQSGRIFYDTLLDENAVCHMALGRGTPGVLPGGYELARSELDALGVNSSAIHVDFMIGSKHFDVEADTRAGKRITIMKNGSWAI